jgi:hypothetical protein
MLRRAVSDKDAIGLLHPIDTQGPFVYHPVEKKRFMAVYFIKEWK